MADDPSDKGGRLRRTMRRAVYDRLASQEQIDELRVSIAELEEEVQESRRLNRRIAELTDIVQELLLPASQRDDEQLRERLAAYTSTL